MKGQQKGYWLSHQKTCKKPASLIRHVIKVSKTFASEVTRVYLLDKVFR
jgi:hypothetical protein